MSTRFRSYPLRNRRGPVYKANAISSNTKRNKPSNNDCSYSIPNETLEKTKKNNVQNCFILIEDLSDHSMKDEQSCITDIKQEKTKANLGSMETPKEFKLTESSEDVKTYDLGNILESKNLGENKIDSEKKTSFDVIDSLQSETSMISAFDTQHKEEVVDHFSWIGEPSEIEFSTHYYSGFRLDDDLKGKHLQVQVKDCLELSVTPKDVELSIHFCSFSKEENNNDLSEKSMSTFGHFYNGSCFDEDFSSESNERTTPILPSFGRNGEVVLYAQILYLWETIGELSDRVGARRLKKRRRIPRSKMATFRFFFKPEDTPFGRKPFHSEMELLGSNCYGWCRLKDIRIGSSCSIESISCFRERLHYSKSNFFWRDFYDFKQRTMRFAETLHGVDKRELPFGFHAEELPWLRPSFRKAWLSKETPILPETQAAIQADSETESFSGVSPSGKRLSHVILEEQEAEEHPFNERPAKKQDTCPKWKQEDSKSTAIPAMDSGAKLSMVSSGNADSLNANTSSQDTERVLEAANGFPLELDKNLALSSPRRISRRQTETERRKRERRQRLLMRLHRMSAEEADSPRNPSHVVVLDQDGDQPSHERNLSSSEVGHIPAGPLSESLVPDHSKTSRRQVLFPSDPKEAHRRIFLSNYRNSSSSSDEEPLLELLPSSRTGKLHQSTRALSSVDSTIHERSSMAARKAYMPQLDIRTGEENIRLPLEKSNTSPSLSIGHRRIFRQRSSRPRSKENRSSEAYDSERSQDSESEDDPDLKDFICEDENDKRSNLNVEVGITSKSPLTEQQQQQQQQQQQLQSIDIELEDEEEPVISSIPAFKVRNSSFESDDDYRNFASYRQQRSPKLYSYRKGFEIYLQYVISANLEEDFIDTLRKDTKQHYFTDAIKKIEDALRDRRDFLVNSSAWNIEFKRDLDRYANYHSYALSGTCRNCQACLRSNHPATFETILEGPLYDADSLWKGLTLPPGLREDRPVPPVRYSLGRFCHARSELYHKLHHYKLHLFHTVERHLESFDSQADSNQVVHSLLDNDLWVEQLFKEFQQLLNDADKFGLENLSKI